ncbi:MAG: HEAT repeat domain-containing protein, partial [Candidatus Omnitrophota bacterium]
MPRKIIKIVSILLCISFFFQQAGFAQAISSVDVSGYFNQLHKTIAEERFRPLHLRYLSYDGRANNFNLLLDKGNVKDIKESAVKESTQNILNYFFVGVSLPSSSFWVNLRPDCADQITDDLLAKTDVGKILLEADVQLKKDTAKLTSPDTQEGRAYWDKLYKKAGELFSSNNITIPTLVRPWIVPGEIIIREAESNAYIYKATLKVMLEEDYLKRPQTTDRRLQTKDQNNAGLQSPVYSLQSYSFTDPRLKELNEYSCQLIKELIIPKLTKEINTSKRYAPLRQVYYSLIMAYWFKSRFANKPGVYSELINRQNLNGITSKAPWSKNTYFTEYQKSFKNGEYNIQESVYTTGGRAIRTYFSGGIELTNIELPPPVLTPTNKPVEMMSPDGARVTMFGGNKVAPGVKEPSANERIGATADGGSKENLSAKVKEVQMKGDVLEETVKLSSQPQAKISEVKKGSSTLTTKATRQLFEERFGLPSLLIKLVIAPIWEVFATRNFKKFVEELHTNNTIGELRARKIGTGFIWASTAAGEIYSLMQSLPNIDFSDPWAAAAAIAIGVGTAFAAGLFANIKAHVIYNAFATLGGSAALTTDQKMKLLPARSETQLAADWFLAVASGRGSAKTDWEKLEEAFILSVSSRKEISFVKAHNGLISKLQACQQGDKDDYSKLDLASAAEDLFSQGVISEQLHKFILYVNYFKRHQSGLSYSQRKAVEQLNINKNLFLIIQCSLPYMNSKEEYLNFLKDTNSKIEHIQILLGWLGWKIGLVNGAPQIMLNIEPADPVINAGTHVNGTFRPPAEPAAVGDDQFFPPVVGGDNPLSTEVRNLINIELANRIGGLIKSGGYAEAADLLFMGLENPEDFRKVYESLRARDYVALQVAFVLQRTQPAVAAMFLLRSCYPQKTKLYGYWKTTTTDEEAIEWAKEAILQLANNVELAQDGNTTVADIIFKLLNLGDSDAQDLAGKLLQSLLLQQREPNNGYMEGCAALEDIKKWAGNGLEGYFNSPEEIKAKGVLLRMPLVKKGPVDAKEALFVTDEVIEQKVKGYFAQDNKDGYEHLGGILLLALPVHRAYAILEKLIRRDDNIRNNLPRVFLSVHPWIAARFLGGLYSATLTGPGQDETQQSQVRDWVLTRIADVAKIAPRTNGSLSPAARILQELLEKHSLWSGSAGLVHSLLGAALEDDNYSAVEDIYNEIANVIPGVLDWESCVLAGKLLVKDLTDDEEAAIIKYWGADLDFTTADTVRPIQAVRALARLNTTAADEILITAFEGTRLLGEEAAGYTNALASALLSMPAQQLAFLTAERIKNASRWYNRGKSMKEKVLPGGAVQFSIRLPEGIEQLESAQIFFNMLTQENKARFLDVWSRSNNIKNSLINNFVEEQKPFLLSLLNQDLPRDEYELAFKVLENLGMLDREALRKKVKGTPGYATVSSIRILANLGDTTIIPALLVLLLGSQDVALRQAAIAGLSKIGEPAVSQLIALLQHNNIEVRKAAITALSQTRDPWVEKALIALLGSEDNSLRQAAIEILVKIGEPAVELLIALLSNSSDPDGNLCRAAIEVLGNLVDPRAIEPIYNLLSSEKGVFFLRDTAIKALAQLGDRRALTFIENYSGLRLQVEKILNAAATQSITGGILAVRPKTVENLALDKSLNIDFAEDGRYQSIAELIELLIRETSPNIISRLGEILVRRAAAGIEVIQALIQALGDENKFSRQRAAEVLIKIGPAAIGPLIKELSVFNKAARSLNARLARVTRGTVKVALPIVVASVSLTSIDTEIAAARAISTILKDVKRKLLPANNTLAANKVINKVSKPEVIKKSVIVTPNIDQIINARIGILDEILKADPVYVFYQREKILNITDPESPEIEEIVSIFANPSIGVSATTARPATVAGRIHGLYVRRADGTRVIYVDRGEITQHIEDFRKELGKEVLPKGLSEVEAIGRIEKFIDGHETLHALVDELRLKGHAVEISSEEEEELADLFGKAFVLGRSIANHKF